LCVFATSQFAATDPRALWFVTLFQYPIAGARIGILEVATSPRIAAARSVIACRVVVGQSSLRAKMSGSFGPSTAAIVPATDWFIVFTAAFCCAGVPHPPAGTVPFGHRKSQPVSVLMLVQIAWRDVSSAPMLFRACLIPAVDSADFRFVRLLYAGYPTWTLTPIESTNASACLAATGACAMSTATTGSTQ
jgi:hypothetical protein